MKSSMINICQCEICLVKENHPNKSSVSIARFPQYKYIITGHYHAKSNKLIIIAHLNNLIIVNNAPLEVTLLSVFSFCVQNVPLHYISPFCIDRPIYIVTSSGY